MLLPSEYNDYKNECKIGNYIVIKCFICNRIFRCNPIPLKEKSLCLGGIKNGICVCDGCYIGTLVKCGDRARLATEEEQVIYEL